MRLTRNIDHFGGSIDHDDLQVIFDKQAMEQTRIVAGWERLGRRLGDGGQLQKLPLLVAGLMRSTPSFSDDKHVLPLQAADMHATWFLLYIEAHRDGRPAPPIPGFKTQLPGLSVIGTQETLDNLAQTVLAGMKEQGLAV